MIYQQVRYIEGVQVAYATQPTPSQSVAREIAPELWTQYDRVFVVTLQNGWPTGYEARTDGQQWAPVRAADVPDAVKQSPSAAAGVSLLDLKESR